jgi:hypothetical protein
VVFRSRSNFLFGSFIASICSAFMHVSHHVHSTQVDGQAAAQLLAFEWQHVSVTLSKHQVMSDLRAVDPTINRNKSQSMPFECYFLFLQNIVEYHDAEAETMERFLRKNAARALLDDVYERDSTCDLVFALFVPTSLRFFIILSAHTHPCSSKSTQ